jgi:hypothetical protein
VRHEPLTSRWLEGNCAIPAELSASSPASHAFHRYATSWGAENLFSVSYQWWRESGILRIRYEDLVREPKTKFAAILHTLNGSSSSIDTLETSLQKTSFESFRSLPRHHAWQGKPGLW